MSAVPYGPSGSLISASLKISGEDIYRYDAATGLLEMRLEKQEIDEIIARSGPFPIDSIGLDIPFLEGPVRFENVRAIRPFPPAFRKSWVVRHWLLWWRRKTITVEAKQESDNGTGLCASAAVKITINGKLAYERAISDKQKSDIKGLMIQVANHAKLPPQHLNPDFSAILQTFEHIWNIESA